MFPASSPASGFDGIQMVQNLSAGTTTTNRPSQLPSFVLRLIAFVTTFIAAIVMGVAKETKTLLLGTGVFSVAIKSTGSGLSQLEYFIAVNVIASVHALVSLALSIFKRNSSAKNLNLALTIVDLVMVAFLFSGIGSAAAVGVLSSKRTVNALPAVCNLFGKFCSHTTGAIVVSMFGALAYFKLVLLSHLELHRQSNK